MRTRACFPYVLSACSVLLAAVSLPDAAFAEPVDLELVLAVDVSGSMDDEEHALQRIGYVAALRHPQVIRAIRSGYHGRIAVTYFEWAGPSSQVITVPWRTIEDRESAETFSDLLAATPIAWIRGTSISGGLNYAALLFENNGYEGKRRVVDVSGDGPNNMGDPIEAVRDRVVAQGIVVNGLPLMLHPGRGSWGALSELDDYYRNCVIGGFGAFVIPVIDPNDLAVAIRRKLVREIAGRPARLIPARALVRTAKSDCLIGEKQRRMWNQE